MRNTIRDNFYNKGESAGGDLSPCSLEILCDALLSFAAGRIAQRFLNFIRLLAFWKTLGIAMFPCMDSYR